MAITERVLESSLKWRLKIELLYYTFIGMKRYDKLQYYLSYINIIMHILNFVKLFLSSILVLIAAANTAIFGTIAGVFMFVGAVINKPLLFLIGKLQK